MKKVSNLLKDKVGLIQIYDGGSEIPTAKVRSVGDNENNLNDEGKWRNPAMVMDNVNRLWCFAWRELEVDDDDYDSDEVRGKIYYRMSVDFGLNWTDWKLIQGIGEDQKDYLECPMLQPILGPNNRIVLLYYKPYVGSEARWLEDPT